MLFGLDPRIFDCLTPGQLLLQPLLLRLSLQLFGYSLLVLFLLSQLLVPLKLIVGGLLERLVHESVDALENLTHRVIVAQLDVLREAHSQINLDLVHKVLDALHDQVCPLVEFFKTLLRLLQFDMVPVHLTHLGQRRRTLLLLSLLALQFCLLV